MREPTRQAALRRLACSPGCPARINLRNLDCQRTAPLPVRKHHAFTCTLLPPACPCLGRLQVFELFDIKQNHVIEFGEFVRSLSVFHPKAPLPEKAKCEQLLQHAAH